MILELSLSQDSCDLCFQFFLSFISLIIDGVVTQIVCNRFPNYLSFVVQTINVGNYACCAVVFCVPDPGIHSFQCSGKT